MDEQTTQQADPIREGVIRALRTVFDPEIPVNIYELGLIYSIDTGDAGRVRITMTLTSPNCPVAEALPSQVRSAVEAVEGVTDAVVDLVWDPPWTPDRMSDAARLELEFTGHTGPAHLRPDGVTPLTVNRRKGGRPRR